MHPAGFEPAIPASEPQQTDSLDCVATGIGYTHFENSKMAVSDEAPNIKTEDIIVCCLVRAVAG
jgi:hypothetical protein